MTENEFATELGRIQGCLGEIAQDIILELQHRYLKLPKGFWVMIGDRVIEKCNYLPKVANFQEAYEALKPRWQDSIEPEKKCEHCFDGSGFTFALLKSENGMSYETMIPCKHCNGNLIISKPKETFLKKEPFDPGQPTDEEICS